MKENTQHLCCEFDWFGETVGQRLSELERIKSPYLFCVAAAAVE